MSQEGNFILWLFRKGCEWNFFADLWNLMPYQMGEILKEKIEMKLTVWMDFNVFGMIQCVETLYLNLMAVPI